MLICMMSVPYDNHWTSENPQHEQVYAEKYAVDQDAFFKDYAEAHAKLSNLGAKFNPPQVSVSFPTRLPCHLQFL